MPALFVLIAASGLALGLWQAHVRPVELSYTAFTQALGSGQVASVTISEGALSITRKAGPPATVRIPAGWLDTAFLDRLTSAGVDVRTGGQDWDVLGLLGTFASLLVLAAVGSVIAVQFDLTGRLRWPVVAGVVPERFQDVAGLDEPKAELAEIVTFLKNPASFAKVGARAPRGVLMVGPPGTGKTLLAKALAGESGVAFIAVAGSEFSAAFVGVSKGRVARLFREARRRAPCILFVDEIDSIGKRRGAGGSAADREYDTTLNQLLVEMDGFDDAGGVIVVGATNRVDVLDPALLRPGRFDRQVHVALPDVAGRASILGVHAARVRLAGEVNLVTVARGTPGFSGADLANLVNEAAVFAAREGSPVVTQAHLELARTKMLMGLERRSLVLDEQERRLVAVHEAGHALCASVMPAADPVHAATIVPHGGALGMVMRLPEKERLCVPMDRLRADLVVAMGGRAAEEAVFGRERVTTGAAADISFATDLARRMVAEWGMGPALRMVRIDVREGDLPAEAQAEVARIVEEAYDCASAIMRDRRAALDALAGALLDRETLDGAEVRRLVVAAGPEPAAGAVLPDGRLVVTVAPAAVQHDGAAIGIQRAASPPA
jgi:cell division protease FtsH